jgi:hypothetical protein
VPGLTSDFGRDLTNNFGVIYDYPNRLVVGFQYDDVQLVAWFFQPRQHEAEFDGLIYGFRFGID